MFIVAERINSSRKAINEAIKAQDADSEPVTTSIAHPI